MSPQEILYKLTIHVRDTVRPHLGAWHGRAISGVANSGDATFAIDDVAESAIVSFIKTNGISVALYTEDKGLVEFGDRPNAVLIIDPIDGTRPAIAGFEACVVAAAWAVRNERTTTLGDVQCACVAEIKGNSVFTATRGGGTQWIESGQSQIVKTLRVTAIERAPLTFETVARPFDLVAAVLGDIVDQSSMKGGVFLFNSTAYSLTRLVTGQLAAVLDVGNRIYRDHDHVRNRFSALGGGRAVGLYTYDIAAAALIAQEAGVTVTDAYGNSLDDVALLDTSESNILSIVAAVTPELHALLLEQIEIGTTKIGL